MLPAEFVHIQEEKLTLIGNQTENSRQPKTFHEKDSNVDVVGIYK